MQQGSNLKMVTSKIMYARLTTSNVVPVRYTDFFKQKRVSTLRWESLVGETGAPVMADVISFDASAPEKSRPVIDRLSGDIPKIAIARKMTEFDYNEYIRLSASVRDNKDLQAVLDYALKDQDACYNGVNARLDWNALQLLSRGGILLDITNNNGIVTAKFVSNGMPEENKVKSTANWSSTTTADGLGDIENVLFKALKAGRSIRYVVMGRMDFVNLTKQKSTTDRLKSWANGTRTFAPTTDVLNAYLEVLSMPTKIVVIDKPVKFEDRAHNRKLLQAWEPGRIAFVEDLNVGSMQFGPIAAANSEAYKNEFLTTEKDGILISKYATMQPFAEWTVAETNAMPVLNDPSGIFTLKTDGTDYPANEVSDIVNATMLGEVVPPDPKEA